MTIQLNGKYKLTTDPLNFVLYERKIVTPKDKEPYEDWVWAGYYADERQAVAGCLRKEIMESNLNGVKEITEYIETMTEIICERVGAILDTEMNKLSTKD